MYVFTDVFVTFVVSSLVYCASCITAAFEVIAQRTETFFISDLKVLTDLNRRKSPLQCP